MPTIFGQLRVITRSKRMPLLQAYPTGREAKRAFCNEVDAIRTKFTQVFVHDRKRILDQGDILVNAKGRPGCFVSGMNNANLMLVDMLQDSGHRYDDAVFLRMPSIGDNENSHSVRSLCV